MNVNLKPDHLAILAVQHLIVKSGFPADWKPKVSLTLGSGLGGLAAEVQNAAKLSFKDAWDWIDTEKRVPGHALEIILGQLCGIDVIVFSGRIHCYDGYTPQQSVQPVLLAHALGVEFFLLTNGAGGVSNKARVGCPMIITDQLKLSDITPLRGPNNEALGIRFVDVSQAYNNQYTQLLQQAQRDVKFPLSSGTYMYMPGPQYETKAEVRALGILGADAVGMSTVLETIAIAWLKKQVAAFSLITNMAGGLGNQPVEHTEVVTVGNKSGPQVIRFVNRFFELCHKAGLL